jgi:hypothetical protein
MVQINAAPCIGRVSQGKFLPEDPKGFKAAFYRNEGHRVEVSIKRWQPTRSNPQNKWYWSVIVAMIGEHIGESDPKVVHFLLKQDFNYRIIVVGGVEKHVPESTAQLTTQQFFEFCEKVRRWAAEFLHLYIPDPGEVGL